MCLDRPLLMAVDGYEADLVRQSNIRIFLLISITPKELLRAVENLAILDHRQLIKLGENSRKYFLLAVVAVKFAEILKGLK